MTLSADESLKEKKKRVDDYQQLVRGREEKELLEKEMNNILEYHTDTIKKLSADIKLLKAEIQHAPDKSVLNQHCVEGKYEVLLPSKGFLMGKINCLNLQIHAKKLLLGNSALLFEKCITEHNFIDEVVEFLDELESDDDDNDDDESDSV